MNVISKNKNSPDMVVVVGDVNSTLACCVTENRHQIHPCGSGSIISGKISMPDDIKKNGYRLSFCD